jgi:SAM-dependent methyltransferase
MNSKVIYTASLTNKATIFPRVRRARGEINRCNAQVKFGNFSLMRSINSPSILNPLEERILGTVSDASKHVVVVGDGDGRLARAIQSKIGLAARIFVVEPRGALHKYLDDFPGFGKDPWDVAAFEAEVAAYGPFDAMVFYGLHEYWRGHLYRFQRLVAFSQPNGILWVTFANLSSVKFLDRQLPPLKLAADALASPTRFWAQMDYVSWVALNAMFDARVSSVWGLFDKAGFDFCQGDTRGGAEWELKGARIQAHTPAEVVQWGASYIGVQMTARPSGKAPEDGQTLGGVAFNPHLYQALIDPFPEVSGDEADLAWAATELAAIQSARSAMRPSQMVEFTLSLIQNPDAVRDVLVVGAGWGRDVLMLKTARPKWNIVGVESSASMRAIGRLLREQEGLQVESYTLGGALPFEDKTFDVVITLGFMSKLYDQAAASVVQEIIRVARKGVYHLEDARGPEQTIRNKLNSLTEVYACCGKQTEGRHLMVQEKPTGFVFHKVAL